MNRECTISIQSASNIHSWNFVESTTAEYFAAKNLSKTFECILIERLCKNGRLSYTLGVSFFHMSMTILSGKMPKR